MKQPPYSSTWPNQAAARAHRFLFIVYILTIALCAIRLLFDGGANSWFWLITMILLPAITLLSGIARFLPLQNILGVVFTTITGSTILALLPHVVATFGIPADRFFQCVPLLSAESVLIFSTGWTLAIVGARSSARLILSSLREHRNYGYFVAGMTAVLSCLSIYAAEPKWVGEFSGILIKETSPHTYDLALKALIYFSFSGSLTIAVTPWSISKHPYLPPVEITSPISWLVLNLLITVLNGLQHRHALTTIGVILCSVLAAGIGWNVCRTYTGFRRSRY